MSVLIRTDVTSVKLYKDVILAGIGSFLYTFDRETTKLIQKSQALFGQKIYGIIPSQCNTKLLIFGGKQFTVLNENQCIFNAEFEAVVCDDWIHSGIWMSDKKIALLTAHNVVMIWDVPTKSLLTQHISRDNSILYSGLLLPLHDEILVFSGTVFSQVIIQWCGEEQPLHYLKGHKGVIFSVTCSPEKGIIVTTSDDRSVRVWSVKSTYPDYSTKAYWDNAQIDCVHDLYGHSARVMRNCLTNDCIISVGEDSAICFWDYNGKLLKKHISHNNSSIWSLDADDTHLVTGGSDCGVILHPLSLVTHNGHDEVIDIDTTPKKVLFTARKNIIIARDDNNLSYLDIGLNHMEEIKLKHTSAYQLVSLSSCKQILAVVDMSGKLDVFVENCKGDPELKKIIDTQLDIGKILSMQWAGNRHLVFCSEGGSVTVVASKETITEIISRHLLPPCKERWLTSSALSDSRDVLIAGDRCGHVHLYRSGDKHPAVTMKRVHGRYGATSIDIRNNVVTTTGRDGTVKYFSLHNKSDLKYMSCKDLEFQWVEKFLDVTGKYICGFRERSFVVYDVHNNVKILDVVCGGGHRSWDAVRYIHKDHDNFEEFIRLMYLKNSQIHVSTFRLSTIVSRNIVHGTHSKEINCLKTYTCENNKCITWYISGGEDTTLRLSRTNQNLEFRDVVIFKQLSNVRSLRVLSLGNNKMVVVSGGGRAQICVKLITFEVDKENSQNVSTEELVNYQIKGTDRERKGNQNWRNCSVDFDPETRIMDVEIIKMNNTFVIFAACSDAVLRTFDLNILDVNFRMLQQITYHNTCILKVRIFRIHDRYILISCTTTGEVAFWEIGDRTAMLDNVPSFILKVNKSGINSVDVKVINECQVLVATGGDDNAVHLTVLEVTDDMEWRALDSLVADNFHCSQVTGLSLVDSLCVTTSVDQRVTLFSWELSQDGINVVFVDQKHSDIADIHGMDVIQSLGDYITVCVYGKGIEVIKFVKK